MKNKIKGILEDIKEIYYFKPLLDYITNLQEENERLKELDENYPIEEQLEEALKYENIYKLRNEKAIRFNQILLDSDYAYSQDEIAQKNLNILNGGDKD